MRVLKNILIGLIALGCICSTSASRYALIVGIDEYDNAYGAGTLYSCVNDALGMRRCLLEDSSRWSVGNITTLLNDQATKTAIRNQLTAMANQAISGDVVYYFQSSHGGQYSGTDTFLCSYNDDYEDAELAADLAKFADGVKVVIVIDACNSGGLYKALSTTSGPVKKEWNIAENVMRLYSLDQKARLTKAVSIGWLTAADYDETSLSGNCYSLFAGNIMYGFAHGDASENGSISFQELYDYAAPRTMVQNPGQTIQIFNSSVLSSVEAAAVVAFDNALQNAVDQNEIPVHAKLGPGAFWHRQTAITHDGSDAAQSGSPPDGQSSEFGIRVVGPGSLSYWWKADSESGDDFLSFVVNDTMITSMSGDTGWWEESIPIGPGEHLLRWIYTKGDMGEDGADCGWVDQITWTPDEGQGSALLADAIDDMLLPVVMGGSQGWERQTSTTHDGSDATRTLPCEDEGCAWFTTELIGPGDLSFWWRVSSEEGFDMFEFSINEEIKKRISGDIDWQKMSYTLGAGTHVIGWSYAKDGSDEAGSDCGWVDQVVWTGDCDTDQDGLPTSWEMANGLSHTDDSGVDGPAGNLDGDIHNNLEEWITGMDPDSSTSYFIVTNQVALGGTSAFMIEWPAVPDRVYDVYWSTNLTTGFQPLERDIAYPRNSCTHSMNQLDNNCFYKVDVRLK